MGRPTLWGAGEILRTFFSRAAEPPTSFYLALVKDIAPNPYITGEEINEPDAVDYQRAEIPNDLATFGDQNTGQLHMIYNLNDILFLTALADWGTIGYWALCDAAVGGNVYFYGDFEEPDEVLAGEQVLIPASLLAVEFGPFFFDEEPT